MPVFVLYFLEYMTLADVLRLEAIYYISVVILEVPSGYFSDRVGRRPTLLIASACLVAAYLVFFFGATFATFAVGQVLLAAGLAFNSGTDTSLHFDSLAALGRDDEYDAREAIASRNAMLATGLTSIIGGAAAMFQLRFAYGLSALASFGSLMIVMWMVEPPRREQVVAAEGPIRQVQTCGRMLTDRILAWTFCYAIVMTVLNHVPYEFYQPYIDQALADIDWLRGSTTLTAGVHAGAVMVVASVFASRSIAIRDRIGYLRALVVATALQVAIIFLMGLILHPLLLLVILFRAVPRALSAAPINAAIAPRVGAAQRATFLSLQSLAGRLAFATFLLALSVLAPESAEETGWSAISWRLILSAIAGAAGLAVLAFAAAGLRRHEQAEIVVDETDHGSDPDPDDDDARIG